MQSGEHIQAQMLCGYVKFLSKKSIAFSTSAILQFDDEFRGMVARGEATYDDHCLSTNYRPTISKIKKIKEGAAKFQ